MQKHPVGLRECCCCHSYWAAEVGWGDSREHRAYWPLCGGCRNCLLLSSARLFTIFAGLHSHMPKLTAGLGLAVTIAHTGTGPAGWEEKGPPSHLLLSGPL